MKSKNNEKCDCQEKIKAPSLANNTDLWFCKSCEKPWRRYYKDPINGTECFIDYQAELSTKSLKQKRIERMRELGNIFLKLHKERPDAKVDMTEHRFHPCGTTACHAGWFAAYNGDDSKAACKNFMSAKREMAKFLYFDTDMNLEMWAEQNWDIWGNYSGGYMFYSKGAFGFYDEDNELTLKDIGNHWLGVADRYEASEVE